MMMMVLTKQRMRPVPLVNLLELDLAPCMQLVSAMQRTHSSPSMVFLQLTNRIGIGLVGMRQILTNSNCALGLLASTLTTSEMKLTRTNPSAQFNRDTYL